MATLWFDAEADRALQRLENDPGQVSLLRAVNQVLDQLEADPGHASVRRMRFQVPALWCVTVVADGNEWAILWEPHPERPTEIAVQYVGPASFV